MKRYDINALTAAELAELLTAAGGKEIDIEDITVDIAAGCPTNPDGTLSLLEYTAFLIKSGD